MAKAKKSEFLKGFGKMFEIVKMLVNAVLDIGGDDSDLERILKDADLRKEIAKLIVGVVGVKSAVIERFRVMCDYTTPSYKDLKSAFDFVVNWYEQTEFEAIDMCKSVSREPRELEFIYVYRDDVASTDEVLAYMKRLGLRPALYEELVSFAKAHPDEQRKFPIVALGSICVTGIPDLCLCAYLEGNSDGRVIRVPQVSFYWGNQYRFLAIPAYK